MSKKNYGDLPDINRRILQIINEKADGNVRKFALNLGLSDSSKINRLFNRDKRTNEYPIPSTDIVLLISNTTNYTTDWILKGNDNGKKVNNITIDNSHSLSGDNNAVVGDSNKNINIGQGGDLFEIIKKQQEQIAQLVSIIAK